MRRQCETQCENLKGGGGDGEPSSSATEQNNLKLCKCLQSTLKQQQQQQCRGGNNKTKSERRKWLRHEKYARNISIQEFRICRPNPPPPTRSHSCLFPSWLKLHTHTLRHTRNNNTLTLSSQSRLGKTKQGSQLAMIPCQQQNKSCNKYTVSCYKNCLLVRVSYKLIFSTDIVSSNSDKLVDKVLFRYK